MSTRTPQHLKAFPHGIDITAPGGIDSLMDFHRRTFGDARMEADPVGGGDSGKDGEKQASQPRTFTQDELNAFLAEDRRKHDEKHADYDDLKTKAEKFDHQEQANQTELQRAVTRAEKAEQERDQERIRAEEAGRTALAATVAQEKGVPTANISGTTREELEQSAAALIAWRGTDKAASSGSGNGKVGGYNPLSGTGNPSPTPRSMLTGRERAEAKRTKHTN